jgi:hypothetical protein
MSGKTSIYAGIIIPAPIVDRIETRAATEHPDSREIAGAFEVGALMAYTGRMPILTASTPEVAAYRNGQVYGASLRTIRCHACKGVGVSECRTIKCTTCHGSGEAPSEPPRPHTGTESLRVVAPTAVEMAVIGLTACGLPPRVS